MNSKLDQLVDAYHDGLDEFNARAAKDASNIESVEKNATSAFAAFSAFSDWTVLESLKKG